jgi:hypothetical protein
MKTALFLAIGACAALLYAAGASAKQTEPAPAAKAAEASTLSPVTVTPGAKPNPLTDPTTQFVREHLPESTFSEQYPRFRDAICVHVQGLPAEYGDFIAKRILAVAAQVHAPVATAADCKPNIHVVFETEPQKLLNDMAKRKDILLGFYWNASDLKRIAMFKGPIQSWYITRTRGQSGESRLEIHDPTDYLNPRVGRAGSRLSNGMSTEVVHSLIVADANKVAGEKIDAVADYIAVLALAKWKTPERCGSIPSILNLLAEDCAEAPPQAATPADLALLTGLYSVDPRELGSQQRATIASAIRKAGEPAEPVQR